MEDINLAIIDTEEALNTTPDHPNRLSVLANLRDHLNDQFQRTGCVEHLSRAIKITEMAVDAMNPDHIDRGAWLTDLGMGLHTRFVWARQMKDIDQAIEITRLAVEITPLGHQNQAERLNNLGNMFCRRFEEVGDMNNLDRAVNIAKLAVDASFGHSDRGAYLSNLGNHLGLRFRHTGSIEDLNLALNALELALKEEPPYGRHQAILLTNLAKWLSTRFDCVREKEDLDSAVEFSQKALVLVVLNPDHPNKAPYWINYLLQHFKRAGNKDDIDLAITLGGMVLEATPSGHPERAAMLANLADGLGKRFDKFGEMDDIDQAVQVAGWAVEASPSDFFKRSTYRANLGSLLNMRYMQTTDINDLSRAIQLTEEATKAVPVTYPDRAQWLANLADYLETRYKRYKDPGDIKLALVALKKGWNCQNAPPATRIMLARKASVHLADQSNWNECSELLEKAMLLLSNLSQRYSYVADKQDMLGQFMGLASMATAVALNAKKDPCHALQLLELGRGAFVDFLLEMSTDISTLRQKDAKLADELVYLREKLDTSLHERRFASSVNEERTFQSLESRAKQRREAEERLEEIHKEIRSKLGFESFSLPPTAEELDAVAAQGPVVVINATSHRCDAFLLQLNRPIVVLNLPKLHLDEIEYKIMSLRTGNQFDLRQTLEWLWDVAASPILDTLGYTQTPTNDKWPRIWWIPTGKLTQLPFHAAGRQFGDSNNTVLDRVMSSYSSSIKALVYGRQIPNAALSQQALVTVPFEPSQSSLILRDGGLLTIAHLRECKLQERSSCLTYLYARDNRMNAANRLADVDIHIISACQLVGFRHVVGTLWKVSDKHCISVAKELYETIRDEGITDDAVCRGLHKATKQLRDRERNKNKINWNKDAIQKCTNERNMKIIRAEKTDYKLQKENDKNCQRSSWDAYSTDKTWLHEGIATKNGFAVGSRHNSNPELWAAYIHMGV